MASDNTDKIIDELGGCGLFQVVLSIICYLQEFPVSWNMQFMVFGGYNPGMECVHTDTNISDFNVFDNVNSTSNGSTSSRLSSPEYTVYCRASGVDVKNMSVQMETPDSARSRACLNQTVADLTCDLISTCNGNIRFKDATSTVVTEWNLLCHKAWISSLIISVQMAGVLCGAVMAGDLANRIGRKFTIFGATGFSTILNVVSAFSVNWYMFIVLRFFIGLTIGTVEATNFVYQMEFLPRKCRGIVSNIPDWNISSVVFALLTMGLKDWAKVHFVIAGMAVLACLPVFWAPESMRWLALQGRVSEAKRTAGKIATLNRKPQPNPNIFVKFTSAEEQEKNSVETHTYGDLFRGELRKPTIIMGIVWFAVVLSYYAVGFGVQAFSGNFYINFILMSIVQVPMRALSALIVTVIGRRWGAIGFTASAALACFIIVALQLTSGENRAGLSTTVLAIFCSACLDSGWRTIMTWNTELYPTTFRSLAFSFSNIVARTGSIIAPYLIPKTTLPLFASFLILGSLMVVSFSSMWTLPETKNRPMLDVLGEEPVVPDDVSEDPERLPEDLAPLETKTVA